MSQSINKLEHVIFTFMHFCQKHAIANSGVRTIGLYYCARTNLLSLLVMEKKHLAWSGINHFLIIFSCLPIHTHKYHIMFFPNGIKDRAGTERAN